METVAPATLDEVAAAMRDGRSVLARGAGTKLGWGPPGAADVVLDLSGLDRIVDHAAGDMVVQVEAGVRLDRLAPVLSDAGQQLAIDVPSYDDGTVVSGTVGGALAVGISGPRRLRYGRPRDLLLGVTMVRADGVVASSGGRVVKNVAGYDLGKLLCGSYGTLGVIASATLRLHPIPAAARYVVATGIECAAALLGSQLAPSAVELDRPAAGEPGSVAALFEGTEAGVAARVAAAASLTGGQVVADPPDWFGRWPGTPAGTLIELSFPPAALAGVLGIVGTVAVRGSAAPAVLHIGLPPDAGQVAEFLSSLRTRLASLGGAAVVRHSPSASIDWWGPVDPGALALMRSVKDQFDPDHRLAPGRFVTDSSDPHRPRGG
jgi:glycolate dehydrogenase FAD-binding subunit